MLTALFLPGAGGSPTFWTPVARRLPEAWDKVLLGWPGLGDEPHDPSVKAMDDLVRLVDARVMGPVDVVAQSMGGVVAARLALRRPHLVRRLVLVATSAGIDMERFGAADWRQEYRRLYPQAADWILAYTAAEPLPIEAISVPTLLIWGGADPISPVAAGQHLESRIPNAKLQVIPDADHDVAVTHAGEVAHLIATHLG